MVQDLNNFLHKYLPLVLLGTNSINSFERFSIPKDRLEVHPENWYDLEGYNRGKEIIESLREVDDTANKEVKLFFFDIGKNILVLIEKLLNHRLINLNI